MEAVKRVVIRAKYLEVRDNKPIVVLKSQKNNVYKYIDDSHVIELLREVAKKTYSLKYSKVLSKFTSHSIRVGAYVKNYERGCDSTFIQTRLRWRSLAFTYYLRNTEKLATIQSKIIDNPSNNNLIRNII